MAPGLALVVAFSLPGCGGSSASTTTAQPAERPAITTRAVAIGNGRRIELQCRGTGFPTVVLISGAQGAWDDWTNVSDPAAGEPKPSPLAVFPQAARLTRACGYDRPGVTTLDGKPTSTTPVHQPTTAQSDVADLKALLTAARVPAPYVLVGQSWGGLVAQLYARRYPVDVKGLVLVDPANQFLRLTLSPEQWRRFLAAGMKLNDGSGAEVPDHARSVGVLAAVAPLPRIPTVVLTADHPFDYGAGSGTWPAWVASQARLATLLHARHVTQTDSGHVIQMFQPALINRVLRRVVGDVRAGRGMRSGPPAGRTSGAG